MNDVQHNNALAFSARVLGALFYFAPNSTLAEPLVTAFTDGEWVTQWPYEVPHANTLSAGFASPAEESLAPVYRPGCATLSAVGFRLVRPRKRPVWRLYAGTAPMDA